MCQGKIAIIFMESKKSYKPKELAPDSPAKLHPVSILILNKYKSLSHFCELSGILSRQSLEQKLSGKLRFNFAELCQICDFLHVSPTKFFNALYAYQKLCKLHTCGK